MRFRQHNRWCHLPLPFLRFLRSLRQGFKLLSRSLKNVLDLLAPVFQLVQFVQHHLEGELVSCPKRKLAFGATSHGVPSASTLDLGVGINKRREVPHDRLEILGNNVSRDLRIVVVCHAGPTCGDLLEESKEVGEFSSLAVHRDVGSVHSVEV